MARINTNVPAIVAQRTLQQSNRDLTLSLERLSSGLRINRGADDPAGLINSETLRGEIAGTEKAIGNSQRAISIIATTEGALTEINSLMVDIQGLIVEIANDGGMSQDEKDANQLQIDSAIESITRIANTATFAGRKLLNGELGYITEGVDDTMISTLAVHGAQFGTASQIPVDVDVTTMAEKAMWTYTGGDLAADISVEFRGVQGTTVIEFVADTTPADLARAVNAETQASGIEAIYDGAAGPPPTVTFQSVGYGTDEFVEVKLLPGSGAFDLEDAAGVVNTDAFKRTEGVDAVALINGARTIGRGLDIVLNTRSLDLALTLNENVVATDSTGFAVTGGGAMFQLGPEVTPNQQVNIGIQSVAASRLGNAQVGFLSQIKGNGDYDASRDQLNANRAGLIVDESVRQIAVLRGRLGAFERNTLQTNINSLTITMENLTASESAIRDTDFAAETSRLTRSQILVNAGTSVLALANTTAQSVLSLLG